MSITLDSSQKRRLEKLNALLGRLKDGEHVQNKTLKNWLEPAEYQRLFEDWGQQLSIRDYWSSKPSGVCEYERGLRQAMFNYNKAEGYAHRGNNATARRFYNKAQSGFESSIQSLENELSYDPSIRAWFDRDLNFGEQGDISLSPTGMPRVITSRSLDNQSSGSLSGKMTKAQVKMTVINEAIEAITSPQQSVDTPSIEEMLKKLRGRPSQR